MGDIDVSRLLQRCYSVTYTEQGASPKEQILDACRRDNVELFKEVLSDLKYKPKQEVAEFFNEATDTMGNHLLHICATYGACMYWLRGQTYAY